jgi:hypothetical protein
MVGRIATSICIATLAALSQGTAFSAQVNNAAPIQRPQPTYQPSPPPRYQPPPQPAPVQSNEPVCIDAKGVRTACQQRPQQQKANGPVKQQASPQQVRPQQGRAPIAGQVGSNQRTSGPRAVVRLGVIRGPAGALRQARPTNVAHNPAHRVGRAGTHYNRQAFLFKRGGSVMRRIYYKGPGGGVFFYDEDIEETDPTYTAISDANQLPECPEDSDDCQGFDDPAPQVAAYDPSADARAQALQFLNARFNAVGWREEGIVATHADEDQEEVLVPYQGWRVTVEKRKAGFIDMGDERLRIQSSNEGFFNILVGSYDQNKPAWDKVLSALGTLGVRITPPGLDERNIMSTKIPFRP